MRRFFVAGTLLPLFLATFVLADNSSYTNTPTGSGMVIDLGTTDYGYNDTDLNNLTAGSVINARNATWRFNNTVHAVPWADDPVAVGGCADPAAADPLPKNSYPLDIGTSDVWLQGGTILGQVSWLADWSHHYCNSAALVFDHPPTAAGVEGIRIDHPWDAIRFATYNSDLNATMTVRHVWVSNNLDDGIENDNLRNIMVEDSLFDNQGPSFLSMRPGPTYDGGSRRMTHTATVRNTLVSFREYISVTNGEGWRPRLIKGSTEMPRIIMDGVVMALPYFPNALEGSWGQTWSAIADGGQCSTSTNWFLWTSDTPLPWLDPATDQNWPYYATGANTQDQCQANPSLEGCVPVPPCFSVKTGRAAREHWTTAKAAWIREHSDLPRIGTRTLPDGTVVPADPPGRQ